GRGRWYRVAGSEGDPGRQGEAPRLEVQRETSARRAHIAQRGEVSGRTLTGVVRVRRETQHPGYAERRADGQRDERAWRTAEVRGHEPELVRQPVGDLPHARGLARA